MMTLNHSEQETSAETKVGTRLTVFDVAAVLTLILPVLTLVQAVFFILANVAHPEWMTTRGVVTWGVSFAVSAALTVAAAATAYVARRQ